METYKNYIDGEWVVPSGDKTVPNVNPANTNDIIGHVQFSTNDDLERAVAAAIKAQKTWRKVPAPQRARIVSKARAILETQVEPLATALTREEGKILREARGEVRKALNIMEFMAGEGLRFGGVTRASELENTFAYTIRQPIGVVGLITPWNFPVAIPIWKLAPALIAGNACIFKPATNTPKTAAMVVQAFHDAGLPAGVLNLIFGSGRVIGDAIVKHPKIPALSFTGSTEVGTRLYTDGAALLKKVQCEMGGKNPIVVLEDADIDLAAAGCAQGAFGSTGQRCTATSRAIVMRSVADAFVAKVKEHAEALVVGDGLDEATGMGPSVDQGQFDTVLEYLKIGKDEGATLVTGGERLSGGAHDNGFYAQPTIFDHVAPTMRIAREEVFGPVLSVLRVDSFDEALDVANDVDFGLTSSLYTNDPNLWFRFVDEIETGITHLNSPTMGGEAQLPFGGIKATGVGAREMSEAGIHFFSEEKTVYADYTGRKRESNIY